MSEGSDDKLTDYERGMRRSAQEEANAAVRKVEETETLSPQQRAAIWDAAYRAAETRRFERETRRDESGE